MKVNNGSPLPAELLGAPVRKRKRRFDAGTVLMRQGEIAASMHFILSGRVLVERHEPNLPDPIVLAELGPGQVVGEIGVLTGQPRSATVTAIEATETIELRAGTASWKPFSGLRAIAGERTEATRARIEAARRRPRGKD